MPKTQIFSLRLTALSLIACFLLVASALQAKAEQEAIAFLEKLQNDTLAELTDTSLDEAQKEAKARDLFTANFDTAAIGRFVVGRYWRSASPEEQEDFLQVFEDVIVQRFVPLFEQQSDSRFTFGPERKDDKNPEMSLVSSQLTTPKNEVVKVVWRVREKDGTPKVLDVIVEGASMALTLRSEYSSFIKSSGGKVASLTDSLREKVERGAFRGEVN